MQLLARHINRMMLIATMLCVFASCASDQSEDVVAVGSANATASAYVSLTFTASGSATTRANPTGGEEGDGEREHGQTYENTISDAVAFLFRDENGVNGQDTASVTPVYFDEVWILSTEPSERIDRTFITKREEVSLPFDTYQVLVVANPGDDSWWDADGLTLGEVRDHIQQSAWTEADGSYSDFVMSSESDAAITIDETSTYSNPASAEVEVERMAARIDYKANGTYTCSDENYAGATVTLTGACLVNNLTAGSYLFKRVAQTVGGEVDYLGDETADANGVGTNYVIDPWTADKTASNLSSDATGFTINGVSGRTVADLYGTWWGDNEGNDPQWWADRAVEPTVVTDDDGVEWLRIGYTMENTTSDENSDWRYNTAVVFKATFNPVGISNYKEGSTFFAFGEYLFASVEDLMAYVYKEDVSTFDSEIDACTSWSDVETFANGLLDNDPSGYKAFLLGEVSAATEWTNDVKETLKWNAYMLAECGYSATTDADGNYVVTLNQNGKVTAEALAEQNTRTYVDATCYYTWWVRHANNNNDLTNGVMEFATVRNCIYKLTVNSIYSLGGYVPGDENIVIDVYLKDWTLLGEETIVM